MSDTPTVGPPSTSSLTLVPFPPPASSKSPSASSNKKESRVVAPPSPSRASSSGRTLNLSGAITKRDRDRWRKWRDGQSEDEIAIAEHSDVLKVRRSIQKVLSYQSSVSHEAVDMAANELAIGTIQKMGQLIDDVLQAEKDKTITDADGKESVISVPDLKMRLGVFDKITKLIQSVRKGDGFSVNVNQNNIQNNVTINKKGLTVEERIRAVREKNRLKNDDEGIIDAELVNEEEDEEYEGEEDEETGETVTDEDSPEE